MNQLRNIFLDFKWLVYPAIVLVFILFTIKYLIGLPGELISQISASQKSVTESAQIVSRLKVKLNTLTTLDENRSLEDLSWLGGVIPVDKQIDVIVSELRFSASQTNSELLGYTTMLGDVVSSGSGEFLISASFNTPDMPSLVQLISSLNSSLPLMSISSVQFVSGSASMEINGAWFPLVPHQARLEDDLPNHVQAVSDLKARLEGFSLVPVASVDEAVQETGEIIPNPNPFTPLVN
jgi:hypothetical protein